MLITTAPKLASSDVRSRPPPTSKILQTCNSLVLPHLWIATATVENFKSCPYTTQLLPAVSPTAAVSDRQKRSTAVGQRESSDEQTSQLPDGTLRPFSPLLRNRSANVAAAFRKDRCTARTYNDVPTLAKTSNASGHIAALRQGTYCIKHPLRDPVPVSPDCSCREP